MSSHNVPPPAEVLLGSATEVVAGSARLFQVGDRKVAVVHTVNDEWFAVQATCPHAGAVLTEGSLGARTVMCPSHGYRFDLSTGACLTDPSYRLRTFVIRVIENQLWLQPAV